MKSRQKLKSGEFFAESPFPRQTTDLLWLRPYVRQSGNERREAWFIEERKLLDYLLVYIVQGSGAFSVAGNKFGVKDGDLIWVPPDTLHQMRGFAPEMQLLYVHFDLLYDARRSHWDAFIPGGKRDLADLKVLLHPPLPNIPIKLWRGKMELANHVQIGHLLKKICLEHLSVPRQSILLLSALMLQVVAEIHAGLTIPLTSARPVYWIKMQEALESIQERVEKQLPVHELAQGLRLSDSHFRKLFREIHGQSPRTLHRLARLQRARELLISTQLTVSEIADRLGFSTVHNLSRAFKQVNGISPRQYREGRVAVL